MVEFIVLRHGETVENSQRICQGQTEGTLSERGWQQVKAVAMELSAYSVDAIYSSPLRRAVDTAMAVQQYHTNINLQLDGRLMERRMGVMEGKVFPDGFDYTHPIPESESLDEVFARVKEVVHTLAAKHQGQTVLLVSHGITIRMVKCLVGNIPLSKLNEVELQPNATYFRFGCSGNPLTVC